jgi:MFS family permease
MSNQTKHEMLTRDFALTFLAQLTFASVLQIFVPTLPIYLNRLGSTEIEIGLLVGIQGLTAVGWRPLVGRWLLKVPEKSFMIAGAVIYTIGCIGYLMTPHFWPLLLVRTLQGTGFAFFHTASTTYIVNITEAGSRARILGYFSLTTIMAGGIAPPLGIAMVNRFGFTHLFLACSVISLCMLLIAGTLGNVRGAPGRHPDPGDRFLLCRRAIQPSFVGFLVLFIFYSLTTFIPLYARSQGVANPGIFFTAMATMLFVCRLFGGKMLDVARKERIIFPCLVVGVVAMVILSFSRTLPMFILVAALWGTGHAFLIPSLMAYTFERAGASPGPAVATFYAISDVGTFLGPLIMGTVIQYTGYRVMFLCLAMTGLFNLLYFCSLLRTKDGETSGHP